MPASASRRRRRRRRLWLRARLTVLACGHAAAAVANPCKCSGRRGEAHEGCPTHKLACIARPAPHPAHRCGCRAAGSCLAWAARLMAALLWEGAARGLLPLGRRVSPAATGRLVHANWAGRRSSPPALADGLAAWASSRQLSGPFAPLGQCSVPHFAQATHLAAPHPHQVPARQAPTLCWQPRPCSPLRLPLRSGDSSRRPPSRPHAAPLA